MKTILQQLYLPFLSKIGFFPIENKEDSNNCGVFYGLDPSIGTGFYWVYPVDYLYSITIYDLVFKCDISFEYTHPPFISLSLSNYKVSHRKVFFEKEIKHLQNLVGYIGNTDVYCLKLNRGVSVRNVSISLMPEFYNELLPQKYSWNSQDLIRIFSKLNDNDAIPEIVMILKQLRTFKPSSEIAKMYYESKIMELISLVIHWGKNQILFPDVSRVPDSEMEHLNKVLEYLNQNYTNSISLNALAKIACMSHNKLTNSFKQVYGSTITEYIQLLRINKSKEMLLNSDWKIGDIANRVGYKLHGSFSEIFKRSTGLTPNEFRKNAL